MAQLFPPSSNTWSRASMLGMALLVATAAWILGAAQRSPWLTQADVVREQPVPFSHKHHVAGLGLDCRYCHTSVEDSAFAGIPPTKTCMGCHSQVWVKSPMLEPVRESFRSDRSIEWLRVHDLADFAYFNHGIHVRKGIGCSTCHGRVDQMPLTWRTATLHMEWCLECHRAPERFVRPRESVFDMEWTPPANQIELGRKLVAEYRIKPSTSCSTCHR